MIMSRVERMCSRMLLPVLFVSGPLPLQPTLLRLMGVEGEK